MNNKIFQTSFLLLITQISFTQINVEKVEKLETLSNGVVVYQAVGVQTKTVNNQIEPIIPPTSIEDWDLNQCEIALSQVEGKILVSKENGQNSEQMSLYLSAVDKLKVRIEQLKQK